MRPDNRSDSISRSNIPKWQTDTKLMIEEYLPSQVDFNSPEGIKTTKIEDFQAINKVYVEQKGFVRKSGEPNAAEAFRQLKKN